MFTYLNCFRIIILLLKSGVNYCSILYYAFSSNLVCYFIVQYECACTYCTFPIDDMIIILYILYHYSIMIVLLCYSFIVVGDLSDTKG